MVSTTDVWDNLRAVLCGMVWLLGLGPNLDMCLHGRVHLSLDLVLGLTLKLTRRTRQLKSTRVGGCIVYWAWVSGFQHAGGRPRAPVSREGAKATKSNTNTASSQMAMVPQSTMRQVGRPSGREASR